MTNNLSNRENAYLSVRNLVVEYSSEGKIVHAVNGVSFDLAKGTTLGIVGETGAGKTSVAKAIMRVLPDPPARIPEGQILVDGEDILQLSDRQMQKMRGKKMSIIFQDPMTALNPVKKVVDQIAEVIREHNDISRAEATLRAIEMLKKVGISEDRAREYPHQFSGGMKQRVVIAIALACNPDLLLADEPTTALDVTIQAQVLDLIENLKREYNTALVLITHDLGVVAEACDEVAVMYAGEIIEYGEKIELFDHPRHPYTKGLFGSLPDIHKDVKRLSPIHGMPPDPTCLPKGCSFYPRCPRGTKECESEKIPLVEVAERHYCRCCKVNSGEV